MYYFFLYPSTWMLNRKQSLCLTLKVVPWKWMMPHMHVADLGTLFCCFPHQPVYIHIYNTLTNYHKTDSMYFTNFSEYFIERKNQHGREDWTNIKWKPGTIPHTFQSDGVSCGVFVMQVMTE